jgi:N-glycosylase/DNA lyase
MKNNLIQIDFIQTPTDDSTTIVKLKSFWNKILPIILEREKHFDNIWNNGTDEEIFAELVFCIFTPQSKAVLCWAAVNKLAEKNMILDLETRDVDIVKIIDKVRFKNNKAKYVIEARNLFTVNNRIKIKDKIKAFKDVYKLRKWLIKNIRGIGCKESSHFLRNIGIGKNFAILDRHILKNLKIYEVIKEIPKNLNTKTYLKIEKQMQDFAKQINIPILHLDMLFWSKITGGIFK